MPRDASMADMLLGAGGGLVLLAAGLVLLRYLEPAYLITIGLMLSVFSGQWSRMGVPVPLDRVAIAAGIGGAMLAAWRQRKTTPVPLPPLYVAMAILVVYTVGSALWADTITERERVFRIVDIVGVFPFLLLALAPLVFRTSAQRGILLGGLVALGAYLAFTALMERLGVGTLVFPSYIADPSQGIHFGRARGPFVQSAANGLALYTCAVASVIAYATWTRPLARRLAAVIAFGCVVGVIATVTRQVWVGAALGTLLAMLASAPLRRLLIPVAVATALVAVVSFAALPGLRAQAESRASDQNPVYDRLNSDNAALAMIAERPLLGFGFGTFPEASRDFYSLSDDYPLRTVGEAHNVFLGYAADLGLPWTMLWTLVLASVLLPAALRRAGPDVEPWRLGLIAVAVSWFVAANLTPLGYPFPGYVLWLWIGVVTAGLSPAVRRTPTASPAPASARTPVTSATSG